MSVRDHRLGRVKTRKKLPEFVRKAGPHTPRSEHRNSKGDVIRRALREG